MRWWIPTLLFACAPPPDAAAPPASSTDDSAAAPTGDTAPPTTPWVDSEGTADTSARPTGTTGATGDSGGGIDSDGDGLPDAAELAMGTDPTSPDTDGGGLLDGAEVDYGLDPLDPADDVATVAIDQAPAHYVGRWGLDDPTAPWCAWQGCTLAVRFDGTGLALDLDPGMATEGFRVLVDGLDHGRLELPAGMATHVLVEGLDAGEHDLELVRETYRGTSWVVGPVAVTGVGLVTPSPRPTRRFVFYGDSNLAGDSLSSERNDYGWQHVGTHFGLAGILSRRFDADYHNISVSGETVSGIERLMHRMDWWSAQPTYDHSRFEADVVVVNVGANDVGRPVPTIQAEMRSLWAEVRAAHPDAHIVIANGFGWSFDEPANYTRDVAAQLGDPNLSVVHFPWVFEQWHGCEYDHAGMADVLARHLEGQLGWKSAASDVLVGFAVDGVVANGSFEQVAPFGGYGWRYLDGPGVERLVDPAMAHDGDAYLSLQGGGEVHQPWPVTAGQTVEASLWLHGELGGEVAVVTLDMRNQAMYTQPMASTTETFPLTQGWQQVSMSMLVPDDTPQPVVHTRLTVRAASGVVGVDEVATSLLP